MKWLLATLLALSLAGCADGDNFDREKPIKLAAATGHVLSLANSAPPNSFAARAEASRAEANESANNSPLMECKSDACKTQCSPALEKQSRPKWCMYFKEPIDR
jgi:hypothetical protein